MAKATFRQDGESLDYTPGSAVTGGDVVLIGTIPMVAKCDIAAGALGSVSPDGVFDIEKDTSTFAAGDAVYWDENGNSVGGVAGTGAATSTASGNNLMGVVTPDGDAATGDETVRVKLTAAKRTTTIAGSVTADDITGSDSNLGIFGKAGAAGGAGGIVTTAGGAGDTNGAGGAVSHKGGPGAGTGAGGAHTSGGGDSGTGATGNGGAASHRGGAALSTNGSGGAVTYGGGPATGTGTGGATTITSGASGGASGTAGAITIDTGAATGGTGAGITIGGTNATHVTFGKMPRIPCVTVAATGTDQTDAAALVEGFNLVTAADDTVGVKLPSAVAGMQVVIKVAPGADLKVWPNTGDKINGGTATTGSITVVDDVCFTLFAYDATDWYTLPLLPS